MSSKINLQTCEYACKSSIFQDNQLIYHTSFPDLYEALIFFRCKNFVKVTYYMRLLLDKDSQYMLEKISLNKILKFIKKT